MLKSPCVTRMYWPLVQWRFVPFVSDCFILKDCSTSCCFGSCWVFWHFSLQTFLVFLTSCMVQPQKFMVCRFCHREPTQAASLLVCLKYKEMHGRILKSLFLLSLIVLEPCTGFKCRVSVTRHKPHTRLVSRWITGANMPLSPLPC